MDNKHKSVRVAPFRDACVMDKSSSITGYFTVCQLVVRNREGVRDENVFLWFFVNLGASKLSQMLIQSIFYIFFDKPFIDSDKKPAKCHK
jgi:hypothetical protein